MGLNLFEDDDDVENLGKIEINEEYARRFEHNKKREDLQRFEEMKKKGLVDDDDDSSDESEDDGGEDLGKLNNKKEAEFFNALIKIRNKDPVLKEKDAKLFESESDSEPDSAVDDEEKVKTEKTKTKKKPMYLKDLVPMIDEFEDEEEDKDKKKVKSYSEEQEDLKKEFQDAVEKMEKEIQEDGDDFLKVKRGDESDEDEVGDDGEFTKKLDEYFGEDDKLDDNDRFLKDFFRNKMWMHGDRKGDDDNEGLKFSEDEEEIEKQEDYERDFNFRFEENTGDRVQGHSRITEGSVRKKTNARKLQRERKEERMARQEQGRKEELKRLKNLKKKEMMEKLEKIKETAGIGEDGLCLLDEDDLEEEFNPEEHDRKMKAAFGEAYYEAEDVNPEFGSDEDADGDDLQKPDFDKEDELLGLPKGWDETNQPKDGFLAVRERILKGQENTGEEHERVDDHSQEVDEEDGASEEDKRKKKHVQEIQEFKDQFMEGYYKLDYEDTIGDLKTRFKYKPVNPKTYGLKTKVILMLDDKELNQYVPLKTLAPYREKDWEVPLSKKRQIKELLHGKTPAIEKYEKKRTREQETTTARNSTENEKASLEGSNGDTSSLSRKKRRKIRQAELKPSYQRLKAYGKYKK